MLVETLDTIYRLITEGDSTDETADRIEALISQAKQQPNLNQDVEDALSIAGTFARLMRRGIAVSTFSNTAIGAGTDLTKGVKC